MSAAHMRCFQNREGVLTNNYGHSGEREAAMETLVTVALYSAGLLYLTTRALNKEG